jgi:hypothetical protein
MLINFDFTLKHHIAKYSISIDGKKYIPVDLHDLSHFSFQYLRIDFKKKPNSIFEEKIYIKELSLISASLTYSVKNYSKETIKIYAENKCKNNILFREYN